MVAAPKEFEVAFESRGVVATSYSYNEYVKHLVIGAGATLAEAIAQGIPKESCPPLLRDFARKTWPHMYNPHPVLEAFLQELGYGDLGPDPRELFCRLEDEGRERSQH